MYLPNAARHVRSAYCGTAHRAPKLPAPGALVWCLVVGERDLGDTARGWVDSFTVSPTGNVSPAFMRRVTSRMVLSPFRDPVHSYPTKADAEAALADWLDG